MPTKESVQTKSEDKNKEVKKTEITEDAVAEDLAEDLAEGLAEGWQLHQISTDFAIALLQNPNIERYMTRPPLEDGYVQDKLTQGQWLARGCKKMAKDFIEELHKADPE